MNRFVIVILVFVIFPITLLAQPIMRKTLKGKVVASVNNLEGIYVINTNTEKGMVTEKGGYFFRYLLK